MCNRIEVLSAEKPMDLTEDIQAVLDCLLNHFPDTKYLTAKAITFDPVFMPLLYIFKLQDCLKDMISQLS